MNFRPLALAASLLLPVAAQADVRLPEALGDHMVLQQDSEVTLWGWACAGERVEIETSWGVKCQVLGDAQGQWRVKVKTPHATPLDKGLHPEHISFTVPNENMVQINDILIGEVWLCSGQSNMTMMLRPGFPRGWCAWYGEAFWASEESRHADRPGLRLINLENAAALVPQADFKSALPAHSMLPRNDKGETQPVRRGWQTCNATTAPDFSAVGYYYGAALSEKLNVPVGLVTASVGGTGIESWMSSGTPPTQPGRLAPQVYFNGMIAPLTPMTLRGCVWYQGESNVGNPHYGEMFQTLIADWRRAFGQPKMPFYFVQIAHCHRQGSAGAELREAQAAALQVPHTGMALSYDVSDPNNIHPANKRDIGRRLAAQALRKTYGCQDVVADGPVLHGASLQDGKIHVAFDELGGGLSTRDGKAPSCFETADAKGDFAPATATILGDEVLVTPASPGATRLRFGWTEAVQANLISKNGLPARAFETTVK